MNFFTAQNDARKKTYTLVGLFFITTLIMLAALYMVAIVAFNTKLLFDDPAAMSVSGFHWWDLTVFSYVAMGALLVIGGGTLHKMYLLRGGGPVVAGMLGGRLVKPNTTDPMERRLLNVVEEMAIASGVRVPPVFLLEQENNINAFAAGFTPCDAVIGVTRGTMILLSRAELQGIVAHEFSHIFNGDMRLNLRLMGVLHGILMIGNLGSYLLQFSGSGGRYSRGRSSRGLLIFAFLGVLLWIIGSIGLLFGKLIKSAITRQREYLADASAAQFTRNPKGLSGALKKIGGLRGRAVLRSRQREGVSHMMFADGVERSWFTGFSTHPPLKTRIRRLDPSFEGQFREIESLSERDRKETLRLEEQKRQEHILSAISGQGKGAGDRLFAHSPGQAVDQIGAPGPAHLVYAAGLLETLSPRLIEAAHEPFSARALVYSLLINQKPDPRKKQADILARHADREVLKLTIGLLSITDVLPNEHRLPLLDLAMPALKELSPSQYQTFKKNVTMLIEADKKVSLFELALQQILERHLEQVILGKPKAPVQYYAIETLTPPICHLLSLLAHAGHDAKSFALGAFQAGTAELQVKMAFLPMMSIDIIQLKDSLNLLAQASHPIKKKVLRACETTLTFDGKITVNEVELLRAIAATLDCPIPPILTEAP